MFLYKYVLFLFCWPYFPMTCDSYLSYLFVTCDPLCVVIFIFVFCPDKFVCAPLRACSLLFPLALPSHCHTGMSSVRVTSLLVLVCLRLMEIGRSAPFLACLLSLFVSLFCFYMFCPFFQRVSGLSGSTLFRSTSSSC